MKHLTWLCGCLLLVGFAPVPTPRTESNPDKLFQQFEKNARDKDADTVEAAKKKLIASLKKLQAHLTKKGKTEQAEAVRVRGLLAETVSTEHLLGEKIEDLFKAASANKYRHLMRVLLVPGDQANYNRYNDHGFWNGTSYAGVNDLTPGYWVYVYPRWYVWRDGPQP